MHTILCCSLFYLSWFIIPSPPHRNPSIVLDRNWSQELRKYSDNFWTASIQSKYVKNKGAFLKTIPVRLERQPRIRA